MWLCIYLYLLQTPSVVLHVFWSLLLFSINLCSLFHCHCHRFLPRSVLCLRFSLSLSLFVYVLLWLSSPFPVPFFWSYLHCTSCFHCLYNCICLSAFFNLLSLYPGWSTLYFFLLLFISHSIYVAVSIFVPVLITVSLRHYYSKTLTLQFLYCSIKTAEM